VFASSTVNNHRQANRHGYSLHSADSDKSEKAEQIIVINGSNKAEIPKTLWHFTSGLHAFPLNLGALSEKL
jgi:hypothetical protein